MNYEKEFGVTANQVKNEIRRIKMEKVEYDEFGKPVDNKKRNKLTC